MRACVIFAELCWFALEKTKKPRREYREAIRLDPQMEEAYRNLGFLKWNEHQLEPAREALDRAVKLSPNDSFAHYYLGRVLLDEQALCSGYPRNCILQRAVAARHQFFDSIGDRAHFVRQ